MLYFRIMHECESRADLRNVSITFHYVREQTLAAAYSLDANGVCVFSAPAQCTYNEMGAAATSHPFTYQVR